MADIANTHPLGELSALSSLRNGKDIGLELREGFAAIQVFAKKGRISDVADLLDISAKPGVSTITKEMTALPVSPGQWMVFSNKPNDHVFGEKLAKKLNGIGYVSEQSDARICIRVSGEKARDLMARGCRLDLHSSVASKGFCAQTQMAQCGVLIHQVSDAPSYDLYVYSGFARSFWDWLSHTAAQFGYEVQSAAK